MHRYDSVPRKPGFYWQVHQPSGGLSVMKVFPDSKVAGVIGHQEYINLDLRAEKDDYYVYFGPIEPPEVLK